jgi:hypothetical protein
VEQLKMSDEKVEDFLMTKKRFSIMVEETVLNLSLSYLDAIVYLCEKHTIEPEDVKKYISPTIKDKLEVDAMKLNYIGDDGTSSLPLD